MEGTEWIERIALKTYPTYLHCCVIALERI